MEIRAGINANSTEMCQLFQPFARSQVVVVDVGSSMEKWRFELRSSARLRPAAFRIRRLFQVFDIDSRPVASGKSCSLCELRPAWQLEGQSTLTCAACRLGVRLSYHQQLQIVLGSRCSVATGRMDKHFLIALTMLEVALRRTERH